MTRRRTVELAVLPLDPRSQTPLHRQIYHRFRDAIVGGILRANDRLPSARSLASQLDTARGTVDLAYSLLSGEGYIKGRGAAGTFVAPRLLISAALPAANTPATVGPRDKPRLAETAVFPFQLGLPALDAFPRKLWSRLAARRARELSIHSMIAADVNGYAPLRHAVASYLAISRGVLCSPEHVVITAGFQGALGLIARTFLEAGDKVWFEEPGYFLARKALQAAGAELVPVAVDAEGLDVAAGMARAPRARFAYVTPSHQAPLGVSLSLPRRLALLSWAAKMGAWVIEDDYDSEYRYGHRPLPALKSLDGADRVLYVGTFSKALFPGLKLGYLVVPDAQVGRVTEICRLLYGGPPTFNQAVVADFMVEGYFARHIKRMRALYAERRAALSAALERIFEGRLTVQLQAGGMHLLTQSRGFANDLALVKRAVAHGLAPSALSSWSIEPGRQEQGLLLSFTNVPAERAVEMVRRLRKAIGPLKSRIFA